MATKKSLKLCTAALVLIALFAASEVLAQDCLEPDCFLTSTGCKIEVVKGVDSELPLIITDLNKADPPYSVYASSCGGVFPCTVFAYKISANCSYSAINQALADTTDRCPTNQFTLTAFPAETKWLAEGVGGSNAWYKDDTSIRVMVWPSNLSSNEKGFYVVASNNVTITPQPMYLVSGNKQFYASLWAPDCQAPVPPLQLTQTGFTVVHPDGSNHMVLVTFDQFGALYSVEFCDAYGKNCVNAGDGKPQEEVFSCLPGQCTEGGQTVYLNNPLNTEGNEQYCCQNITATVPNKPTTYKAGQNTSCPCYINGQYYDFCAGIYW